MNNVAVDSGFAFVQLLSDELADNSFNLPRFPDTALRIQEALKDPEPEEEG